MTPLKGPAHHLEAQYFYLIFCISEFHIISLWSKKLNGFFVGKKSIFQNNKTEKFQKFSNFAV